MSHSPPTTPLALTWKLWEDVGWRKEAEKGSFTAARRSWTGQEAGKAPRSGPEGDTGPWRSSSVSRMERQERKQCVGTVWKTGEQEVGGCCHSVIQETG